VDYVYFELTIMLAETTKEGKGGRGNAKEKYEKGTKKEKDG
jgi:hypothetical protein